MPILANQRHELMAQGLAMGKKQMRAYKDAGFKPNSKSANHLANQDYIKDRVRELTEVAVANTTLTIERVLRELEKLGFANMLDYIKIDSETGEPELDFKTLTRDQAAAIIEITTDHITSPRDGSVTKRTKFKLCDKKGALVDLGRHLGMFVDRKQIQMGGIVFHVNADDMAL
jgi:phage terminase small subunit